MRLWTALVFALVVGCEPLPSDPAEADVDGDGARAADDCNDADANVKPGAPELCNQIDDNCDGTVDEEPTDGTMFYQDNDGDGHGVTETAVSACLQPAGYAPRDGDCDDKSPAFHPGAAEGDCTDPNDYNCDGTVGYADADKDGFPACRDCDDTNADRNEDKVEICDGFDNDCNGLIDQFAVDAPTWFGDVDADGYGGNRFQEQACKQPSGYVASNNDCDDLNPEVNPGRTEVCDGLDNDCKDGVPGTERDSDGDGFLACEECDDADAKKKPGAIETCDGKDNDCDGTADNLAVDASVWYVDADKDGFGSRKTTARACTQPAGYTDNFDDCNDSSEAISPADPERCDGVDNNCDGTVDEDSATDAKTYYFDDDGDKYGRSSITRKACASPGSGWVDKAGDCDDNDKAYNPGATPGCDGEDYNCDGKVDNDLDEDSYADVVCGGDDCNDADKTAYPDKKGYCFLGKDCAGVLSAGFKTSGAYVIDPDGRDKGQDPIDVYCDMVNDGGGWTLCASLTKGYVPADMLYNADAYAFQARLNKDRDFVFETDAPARTTGGWTKSESLNYGQFCRLMGSSMSQTRVEAKMWNWANNYGATLKGKGYDATYAGIYSGNLFLQWMTNSTASRTFTRISGNQLYVQTNDNGYGGPYKTPHVGWASGFQSSPYTHSTNPWNTATSNSCTGCTHSSGYNTLPYGETTILNDLTNSFWTGIPNVRYGWSDCTANGNCDYHESGMGVWLFWVK